MIFKLLRRSVEGIQNQIMGQLRTVEGQVQEPINRLINEIVSGAWTGDDANAMTNEIRSKVIPMVQELMAAIAGMNTGITNSLELFHRTDNSAAGKVDGLVSEYSSIF